MAILTMESTVKSTKYGNKSVMELVDIKGVIFSMIKDGYQFDDEVLEAAHIKKEISNVRYYNRVGGDSQDKLGNLPKETSSMKQILSELNTIDNGSGKFNSKSDNDDNWDDDMNNFNDVEEYDD